jgi:diacylglycerol kinase family enzyme
MSRAHKLFHRWVLPVLEDAAGMSVSSLITQGEGHATRLVAELQLSSLDCLLFVGGDGTVHEGLQVRAAAAPPPVEGTAAALQHSLILH